MTNHDVITYSRENGGRVLVLFLLFLLALYELISTGLPAMAIVSIIPLLIAGVYFVFQYKMTVFWFLFFANYLIMGINRYFQIPVPITTLTLLPEIMLLITLVIDIRQDCNAKYANLMLLALMIWVLYIFIQVFNRTCMLPVSYADWGRNFLFYGLSFLIIFFLITSLINSPEKIALLFKFWAYLSIAATIWVWRQKTFGWDNWEMIWLEGGGKRTHLIGGSIRYFSFFTDAATFGCCIAASAVVFYIRAINTKIKKDRILFLITAFLCTYAFFMSGTRTALACFIVGVAFYVILSKSIKIAIPVGLLGGLFFFIMAFTTIGENNMQIRRMRSAFNKNDASANVRDINKAALAKYLKDAPFGMGFNVDEDRVPANHKYKIVYQTSNDSTYVFMWQRVGIIGAILFAIVNGLILIGGCYITMFVLKERETASIGAAYCCAFVSIQVGGYMNEILLQFPNMLLYYGGMAIVYLLPNIESEFKQYEINRLEQQKLEERIKLEKKLKSRV